MAEDSKIETPELDKRKECRVKFDIISDFMNWLNEGGYEIGKWRVTERSEGLVRTKSSNERIICKYFGIDFEKCNSERSEIMDKERKEW